MDKEKITNLFKDYGEAMRAWGESKYENDVIYEDIKGLKLDLIEELNSKITMPKVLTSGISRPIRIWLLNRL